MEKSKFVLNSICYLPCRYVVSEYNDEMYRNDIGVDLGVIDGTWFEIFTQKERIHPLDKEKALLEVKLLGICEDKATVGVPGSELVSGRSVIHVPIQTLRSAL